MNTHVHKGGAQTYTGLDRKSKLPIVAGRRSSPSSGHRNVQHKPRARGEPDGGGCDRGRRARTPLLTRGENPEGAEEPRK